MKLTRLFILLFFAASINCYGQLSPEQLVKKFFHKMAMADTSELHKMFISQPSFNTSHLNKKNELTITSGTLEEFLTSITSFKKGELDERIYNVKTDVRDNIATVSMNYEFYLKGKFSHSGINVFHFLKDKNGWKITGIDDTGVTNDPSFDIKNKADQFLNDWHMDATKADSMAYFTKLHERSIFIGTDSSEVWTKKQFETFAGPYFARGKAWDFKKVSRHLHYEPDKQIIWFDEMLDTWMGPCRGSGFINIEQDGTMKIMQYVLSVTVPNEKINGVIEAIKGK